MLKTILKAMAAFCVCGLFLGAAPDTSYGAVKESTCVGVETSSSYLVKIDAPSARIYTGKSTSAAVADTVQRGQTYDVISYQNGWVKINTGKSEGYLKTAGQATVVETAREKVDEAAAVRAQVVDFALQFVGNPYVYGGTDPNTGADCSGFTSYVLRHAAGVSLSHSSVAQAGEGSVVSEEEMKQGVLVFYSNGFRINHVAIYAGNGQVVHASTNKTGIKTSPWNYRTPVKIVRVLP